MIPPNGAPIKKNSRQDREPHNRISGCRTFEYFNAGTLRARRTKGLKTSNKKWRMTEKDFSISHKNRNDRIVIQNHHL